MIPVVVKSYPTNGEENIPLDSTIRIIFSTDIAELSNEDIVVENNNKEEIVGYTFEQSGDKKQLFITINDKNAIGSNKLCGGTKYTVCISNISNETVSQKAKAYLSFYTKNESRNDLNNDAQLSNIPFQIVNVNPSYNEKHVDATYVRIDFTKNVDTSSVNDKTTYLILGSIKTLEEAHLFDINTQDLKIECQLIIKDRIVIIKPNEALQPGTNYVAVIDGITSGDEKIEGFYLPFETLVSPLYCDYKDVLNAPYLPSTLVNDDERKELVIKRIYENSVVAGNLVDQYEKTSVIDLDNPPQCITDYVINKTLYDFVFDKYVGVVSSSRDKKLADLEISYADKAGDLLDLLKLLKGRYQAAEDEIKKYDEDLEPMAVFVKGSEVDEERDFMDRGFKDVEGAKSWI